jgi:serine phosphatase RsbU (regulator of sigma subunit)
MNAPLSSPSLTDRKPAAPPAVTAEQWELARRIHRSMLPDDFHDGRVDVAVRYEEHEILGGDYCSLFKTDDNNLFLCICDVTGHGLPAALLAARISSFVRHEITIAGHPCEVVDTLNRFVTRYFAGLGIYATFFCVEINLRWGALTYAGAGHPPALLWRKRDGTIERLGSLSPLIGAFPNMGQKCQLGKTSVGPGDRLILFTDGLTDTQDTTGHFFGIEGVETVLAALPADADSVQALEEILGTRRRFARSGSLNDDVLVVAARFFGARRTCPTSGSARANSAI